jgi:hypothetical protein
MILQFFYQLNDTTKTPKISIYFKILIEPTKIKMRISSTLYINKTTNSNKHN